MSGDGAAGGRRSETVDRYLETIYYIRHEGEAVRPGRLAEWLGVSAPTVSVSLQRLERDGWVEIASDRSVTLTDAGSAVAAEIVRRHRIVERWLTDALGFDWVAADREAAVLAHAMSDTVVDRLDDQLGHPRTCPHGNVVPGRTPPPGRHLVSLASIPVRASAPIARISEVAEHEAPDLLSALDAGGLRPGIELTVTGRGDDGSVSLLVAGRPHSLSAAVSAAIWVETPV